MLVQFLPPSVLLYTPSPYDTEFRGFASPVPTHTIFGSDCDTATSPIDTVASWSNWCVKVVPWLVVFKSPPEAVATKYVVGSDSTTAIAVMRPLMFAGPIARHCICFT